VAAVLAALGVVFAAGPLTGQAPAPIASGTATITGRALDGVTRAPLPGTVVGLMRNPQDGVRLPGRSVMTDAQGRFAFPGLPGGRYALTATRAGWTMGIYGVEEPRLPELTTPYNLALQNGQRVNVSVPVWRDAVLSGRVTTTTGEAVGNARVYASQWMVAMGRRTLSRSLTFADDRGAFSIRVRPGDYVISALSDEGRARGVGTTPGARFGLATTFYPASPDATGATVISVKSGDERDGLDIRMPLVPAQRVTGTLVSADGVAIPTRISLTSEADTGFQRAVAVGADGRFAFDYVPAGRYLVATLFNGVVMIGGRGGTGNDNWTRTSVEVAGADIDVAVPVHRSLRVSGRVQFDGATAPAAARVTLTPDVEGPGSDVEPPSVPVDSDGRFTVTVTPGRYIVNASAQAPFSLNAPTTTPAVAAARSWTLRSAMSGGLDVSSTALTVTRDVSDVVVTLTDRSAELRGRVLNLQNADDITVLLFPSDESLWLDFGIGRRMRTARPAVDGAFAFAGIPAGEYYVCAVRGMTQRDWRSGALFDVLAPLASRVSLDEGAVTNRDLQAATAPKPHAALLKPPALTLGASDVADLRPAVARGSQGTIAGRVVDAATQAPIAGMRLSLAANLEPGVYSDDTGRFLLTDVAPGQHTIYSLKHGYVPTIYGARRPDEPGTPVSVAVGQHVTDLTFEIMRGASITGTVIDHHGFPMPDVEVGVRQYRWQPQGRQLVAVPTVGRLGPTLTKGDGSFRIYGLAPGDYVLDARTRSTAGISPVTLTTQSELDAAAGKPSGSRPPTMAMYPSLSYPTPTDMARGARLRLGANEERTLSLQMELVPIANVSGLVRGSDGQPLSRIGLQLVASEAAVAGGSAPTRVAQTNDTGQFTITGVLPGQYTLLTRALPIANQPSTTLAGAVDVTVSGDVDGVVLDLTTTQPLTGRVRTRAGTTPQLPNVRLQALRIGAPIGAPAQTPAASWDAEGRFTFSSLLPGRYRLVLSGARNQILPAVVAQMMNGQETLSSGITVTSDAMATVDLVLASGPSQLSGRIRTSSGQPTRAVFLILFARESEAWAAPAVRVFATQPDQNNQFTFREVPPGNYWIAPVKDVEPNGWLDPELLKTLATSAQPVSVVDGNSPELVVTIP
jgi:protocatechuate 3,4-dioxygenase beta subunit